MESLNKQKLFSDPNDVDGGIDGLTNVFAAVSFFGHFLDSTLLHVTSNPPNHEFTEAFLCES